MGHRIKSDTYEEFVEKFKPKLTTDDCYTPAPVYDAVADYVADHYGLDKRDFVRPFYPGGDFEHFPYSPQCVVVDNPPFSILKKICAFYSLHNIRFFLFAPALTLLQDCRGLPITAVCAGASVTYENGASVNTSFLTNLDGDLLARSAPVLREKVKEANTRSRDETAQRVPEYKYPPELLTAEQVNYLSVHGVEYSVKRSEAAFTSAMEEQRKHKKTVFGGGFYISRQAGQHKADAQRAAYTNAAREAADKVVRDFTKPDAITWTPTPLENAIIDELGKA